LDNPELLVGKTDWDIWPQELAARYVADDDRVMRSEKPWTVEEPISDRGTVRWFETFKTPILDSEGVVMGTTGYARDITERKRMEEELQKAQRLDSLGVLAGGIAHDFNNLLTGIFGYIELARSVSKDAQAIAYLESTLGSMNRARALTLQLLTFAKGGAPVQKVVPLVPFIQEAVQFALSGSNIASQFSLADDLWLCNIDKNQIAQVIDNIVINAQQAMPNGGVLEIGASNVLARDGEYPSLANGRYVKVSIKDQGVGMPKDVMPRIFDPFYTTKTKGHGLGLATCYSIVNRHGGCIDVESEPGKGSTFHVYLPASTGVVAVKARKIVERKGSGIVVVVDDDEVVRNTVRKMVEELGYTVVCKRDGKEAIDFYIQEAQAGHRFAGVILDLTIRGGMGGVETVAELRKLDKQLPVFVASGYADDPVMRNPVEYGFTGSIGKPFTIAELSEMLNGNCGG
jgi:signal transduction histidine kinase/CheY-like chemotaxis protein